MSTTPTVTKLFETSESGPETINELLRNGSIKLEHIVSNGKASDPDFWYDQDDEEWVTLVQGKASLQFEEETVELVAGDALTIPAHCKHRVASTSPDAIWIALHYPPKSETS